jgi:hypothetical protein
VEQELLTILEHLRLHTPGRSSGAGTAYHSGASEIAHPDFSGVRYFSMYHFLGHCLSFCPCPSYLFDILTLSLPLRKRKK